MDIYINGFTPRVLPEIRRNRPVIRLCVYWVVPIVGPFFYHAPLYGANIRQNPRRVVELRI